MQVGQKSIQDLKNGRSAIHSKNDQLMIPHASMRKRRSSIEYQPSVRSTHSEATLQRASHDELQD